jgi:hypothetical protein
MHDAEKKRLTELSPESTTKGQKGTSSSSVNQGFAFFGIASAGKCKR